MLVTDVNVDSKKDTRFRNILDPLDSSVGAPTPLYLSAEVPTPLYPSVDLPAPPPKCFDAPAPLRHCVEAHTIIASLHGSTPSVSYQDQQRCPKC